jgi:hypothetical protein
MAVSVTGSKTVTRAVTGHLTAAVLTTLLSTPIENLTVEQLDQISDALTRVAGGHEPTRTIGSLLT